MKDLRKAFGLVRDTAKSDPNLEIDYHTCSYLLLQRRINVWQMLLLLFFPTGNGILQQYRFVWQRDLVVV